VTLEQGNIAHLSERWQAYAIQNLKTDSAQVIAILLFTACSSCLGFESILPVGKIHVCPDMESAWAGLDVTHGSLKSFSVPPLAVLALGHCNGWVGY